MKDIPYQDLQAHHAPMRAELLDAITRVIDSGTFIGGPEIGHFERAFAAHCDTNYAVAVSSGTEALLLALLAARIGRGDEVITAPNSFFATAEAISRAGAKPVFIDVDNTTGTLDITLLEAAITPSTRAIIPVHLHGHPADMDPIVEIAGRYGLTVLEDACQAHGSLYKGRKAGSLGHAACFSFYPGKNLGALGDAGAVVTSSPEFAEHVRALRDHGQTRKHLHAYIGWTGRMDAIQAVVLQLKLARLDGYNEARRVCAARYAANLKDVPGLDLPQEAPYARTNYHVYAVRTAERDRLRDLLEASGVGCGIHYPVPIHLQPAYRSLGLPHGSFPVAERIARESLSLPIYPELDLSKIDAVCEVIRAQLIDHSPYARVA